MNRYIKSKAVILLICIFFCCNAANSQWPGTYPPFTKWYQDPLGLKPLQLSTAFGFVWGSAAAAASLIFTKNDSDFQKKLSFYQEAGFGFGYKPPYTNVFQNDIGLMYEVRKWINLGIGFNTFHFKDKVNDTWSFGIRPFARWYPYKSKKTNLFIEYGAGLSYSLNRFPLTGTGWKADTARTGTKFNLTSKYGIGVEFNLNNLVSIQTGVRHFHLSNGNLAGIQRNPSHDSNGFFIGLIYKLKDYAL
ncbi:MAG: acyloxyacyl hydrolase [Bacteroidia bacterium]|nr:acyloxyacyl hydrolase [Bacteroidia bacterium]